jgi:5'(3')-deoxyribonucleotidase
MSKPIVLIDTDGVKGNFIKQSLKVARQLFPGRVDHVAHDDIDNWHMETCLGLEKDEARALRAAWRKPGFCAGIEPYPHAADGLKELRKVANVYAVTSPLSDSDTWQSERERWLMEHMGFRGPSFDIIQTGVKELVFGHVLVEDRPDTLATWKHRWTQSVDVLWWRNYNQDASASVVIGGPADSDQYRWEALLEVVRALRS